MRCLTRWRSCLLNRAMRKWTLTLWNQAEASPTSRAWNRTPPPALISRANFWIVSQSFRLLTAFKRSVTYIHFSWWLLSFGLSHSFLDFLPFFPLWRFSLSLPSTSIMWLSVIVQNCGGLDIYIKLRSGWGQSCKFRVILLLITGEILCSLPSQPSRHRMIASIYQRTCTHWLNKGKRINISKVIEKGRSSPIVRSNPFKDRLVGKISSPTYSPQWRSVSHYRIQCLGFDRPSTRACSLLR